MKVRIAGLLLVMCVLAVTVAVIAPHHTHSQSSKAVTSSTMSNTERELLNEINQVRAHPQVYAGYLEKLKPLFKDNQYQPAGRSPLMTQEGWSAVDDAIKFLRSAKPAAALTASRGLSLAAMSHVKDQGESGATGHRGADSTFIEQRVKPFGSWLGGIGENITYGDDSARERVLTWLIDDGFASRGHRRRIMSSDYRVAGLSCGPHPEFGAMCVLTLAGGFTEMQATTTESQGGSGSNPAKPKAGPTKSRKMD